MKSTGMYIRSEKIPRTAAAWMARFLIPLLLITFSGCATNAWDRSRSASEVYGQGNSLIGKYIGLYLFPGGNWEIWVASGKESRKNAQGTYKRKEGEVLLYQGPKLLGVLCIYQFEGGTYLVPEVVWKKLKDGSAEFNPQGNFRKQIAPGRTIRSQPKRDH